MYSPNAFIVTDPSIIRDFICQNGFGILISYDGENFVDTHTPLMISSDLKYITGHIARANPQWQAWEKNINVKVIFHGPHAYISPRYYQSDFNVPTWNYSAVSIDGRISVIDDPDECVHIIRDLISQYEGNSGWKLNVNDSRYMKLFEAIVCFSIQIENVEAKFKLNQNKSAADQNNVIACLLQSGASLDRETAELMKLNRARTVNADSIS